MDQVMRAKYPRTNMFVLDEELWSWAKYRAETLKYSSVAQYVFKLIELDKNEGLLDGST